MEPEYDPESGSKNKETLTERRHQVWSPRIRNRNTPTTFGGELDHAQDKKGSEVLDLKENKYSGI